MFADEVDALYRKLKNSSFQVVDFVALKFRMKKKLFTILSKRFKY